MFPFWEVAVAPVLEAAGARRIVEVGALRGENTRQMIERLGPGTELHVIDPLPDFDPAEHEAEFGGQYLFHRALSVDVLGDLPPMDAALIDGDHNWYTVITELRLLRDVARGAGADLPVLLLHDVGWPYGRRDLYYDPSTIPEEHRKEWRRAGMEPGKVRLVPYGAGLNPTLANAKVEGGRHNGVMTALEDFVAEHDRPVRVVVLPIYFGLAIAVEEERLARQPELAAELDRLESPEGKDQLLRLAEDVRLQALIFQHRIYYERDETVGRLARRYLRQLRDNVLADLAPAAHLAGLESLLDRVVEGLVVGDLVSLGSSPRGAAALLLAYADAHDLPGRRVWLSAPAPDLGPVWERADVGTGRLHVIGDDLDGTPGRIGVLHVGQDAEGATVAALLPRLAHGARVVVVDGATASGALESDGRLVADDESLAGARVWRSVVEPAEGVEPEAVGGGAVEAR